MKIGAVLGFNLIDYPGKIAAVAFTSGCNYTCPACHAKPLLGKGTLVNEEDFFNYLGTVRGWVNAVVICGGEPTLHADLIDFIKRLKAENLAVKLDTNGSSPELLRRVLADKLVDYVAMDVKGPRELWPNVCGRDDADADMAESMRIVTRFPAYEFRTTVVPVLRDGGEINFLTAAEMTETARQITEITGGGWHKYYIQKFVPRKGGLLDERLENFPETPPQLLKEMKAEILRYLPKCEIRG